MKAMELRAWNELDSIVLAERPKPVPGPGQVLIRMEAASLNYRDTVMVNRGYGRRSGAVPLGLVSDGAGTVEAVGDGVTRAKPGDLVCPILSQTWFSGTFSEASWAGMLGGPLDGTMQEFMCLSEQGIVQAPAHMSAAEAATLPCAALTAWNAVVAQGQTKAGDLVLIQGTGGVSLFALIFAKMQGAETILISSSDEKLARAKPLGADHLVNYKTTADWGKAAREISGGRGLDHVVEVGGAGTLERSIRAVRPSGIVSLIGVLAGGACGKRAV
ncbi:MAG: NAD(P)-dependent alcohol dehydrogenase [Rhodospirillaceae bacterium]|nr:NAD(P)-dependent alcohol dehydrogenase [Rhodospirillaceae bacterium]